MVCCTSLNRWREGVAYSKPLREKILQRLKKASPSPNKQQFNGETFIVYIFLAESSAIDKWKSFFQGIIDDLTRDLPPSNKKSTEDFYWTKLDIALLPKEYAKYAAVLCGDKLAITPYTSTGRLEDSPTLDVKPNCVIYNLYKEDLKRLNGIVIR
jgi:hypothetical protein